MTDTKELPQTYWIQGQHVDVYIQLTGHENFQVRDCPSIEPKVLSRSLFRVFKKRKEKLLAHPNNSPIIHPGQQPKIYFTAVRENRTLEHLSLHELPEWKYFYWKRN